MDELSASKSVRSMNEPYRRSSTINEIPNETYRRSSTMNEDLTETPKRPRLSDPLNGTLESCKDTVPGSPWEWQRLKGEVISLKTRISHQEATVQQLHKVRREMEQVFEKEKKLLEIQIEQDKQMIKQLELRVDIGRRTVQDAKSAHAQAEQNIVQVKRKLEQKILALVNENASLKEELQSHVKDEFKAERSASALKSLNKESELDETLALANRKIQELTEKLRDAKIYQDKYEIQNVELQNLKIKFQNLDSEKTMWEESKLYMNRASKANELEKELNQAREIIKSLRESIKGKLLLEEQIATMKHRLERTKNLEMQVSQLEVSQAELLSKIAEYEAIGISGGPTAIRRELHRLQHAETLLTAEEGQLRARVNAIETKLANSQQQHEQTKKLLSEVTNTHDRITRFVSRLQKKFSLVQRERDLYKQQLDTYETEVTGNQSNEAPNNLLSERIPALERAIDGYRELVAKLEADLEALDSKSQREECNKLRKELDQLKGELEHRALKGDFNINSRILHFKMNPAAIAEEQAEQKQKALLEEVEKLRTIVASGNHSGVPAVSSLQAQEIAELQQKHEIKITRLKEAFKASSHEYRQACYQLFGWRVDRTKEGQYKLSSQYAESPDDYLFFIVNEDGVNMIETPFSATLTDFIERHLKLQHSVPMFLNAVQSDLFDQQTITTNVLN